MKHYLLLLLTALSAFAFQSQCPSHYYIGEAPDIVNQKLAPKSKELCFEDYGVMHSGVTKTPLWSAEFLSKNSNKIKRKDVFHAEDKLPYGERAERSTKE